MSKALVIKGADFSENALDHITFDVIHAESIALSDSTLAFDAIGDTHTLTYTVVPSDAGDAVQWLTSDSNVATVADGVVTVVGVGSCTITARAGNVTATCAVTVEVELEFGRYTKSMAQASNSTNRLTYIETLHGTSNAGDDKYLLCCNGEETYEHLMIDKDMTIIDSESGVYRVMLPSEMSGGNGRVYNYIGYPIPIILSDNCSKIRCVGINDDYAPYVMFFQSEVRANSTPSSGTEGRGYPCANRELRNPIGSSTLVYQASSEFDVPDGYDSIAVTWVAKDGATVFTSLTESQIAAFKVYAL